jgi:outer membrane protein assembly factor BamB
MKAAPFILLAIAILTGCKKSANPTTGQVLPDTKVTVVDRMEDYALLTWTKPNLPAGDSVVYYVTLDADTIGWRLTGPPFEIFTATSDVHSGQVIAKNTKGQKIASEYTLPAFHGTYFPYTTDGRHYKVNVAAGGVISWEHGLSAPGAVIPAISGDTLFIAYGQGLTATSIKSGNDYWNLETGQSPCYSILYNKGTIYTTLVGYPQRLIAVNSKNKAIEWSFSPDAASYSSGITDPVFGNKTLYFGLDFSIYAVDAVTGKQNWFFTTGGAMGSPATDGTDVYFATQDRYLYSLNGKTGKLNWKYNFGSVFYSGLTNIYHGIVIQCLGDKTIALDAKTGNLLWQKPTSGMPDFRGDTIYMSYSGAVSALKLKTGEELWQSHNDYGRGEDVIATDNHVIYTGRVTATFVRYNSLNGTQFHPLDGLNGIPYNQSIALPALIINGKVYYGNSSSIKRSALE